MKLGLQIVRFNWDGVATDQIGATVARIGQTADAAGFDSLWVMDHFFQMEFPAIGFEARQPMFDGYTLLSFLAGITCHATLGTLVTGVHYRHPGHLIKTVTGLDVLSGGRAILGIGAGWYERESRGLGFPFPPLAERFERLEEVLTLAGQMWRDDAGPFAGRHYQLAEPINHPQPVNRPRILIGGSGEKKTLRLVAQYGDLCNFFYGGDVAPVQQKLDVLKRHCDDVGRNYATIEKTVLYSARIGAGQTIDELLEEARKLAAIGIDHLIINLSTDYTIEPIETMGTQLLPALHAL